MIQTRSNVRLKLHPSVAQCPADGGTLRDPTIDDRIRAALRDADARGKLGVVSAVAGPPVDELRRIMNSTGTLHIMDRGMLALHLLSED